MEMENNKVIAFNPSQDMPRAYRDREEKHFYNGYKVVTIVNGEMVELVDARLGATDSCHYASVWLNMRYYDNDYYNTCGSARGAGKAGCLFRRFRLGASGGGKVRIPGER